MTHAQGAETPPEREEDSPRTLHADLSKAGGSGPDLTSAGRVVDALKSSADQEFSIAERVSAKARQAFALAAGFFVVAQTVAFGSFESDQLTADEKQTLIYLAIVAAAFLALAVALALVADALFRSGDLDLDGLQDDLNAAYAGDPNVTGNLGEQYIGIVASRRRSNKRRRVWYYGTLAAVTLSLAATTFELIISLVSRTN